jgi:hypothetical protein
MTTQTETTYETSIDCWQCGKELCPGSFDYSTPQKFFLTTAEFESKLLEIIEQRSKLCRNKN